MVMMLIDDRDENDVYDIADYYQNDFGRRTVFGERQ